VGPAIVDWDIDCLFFAFHERNVVGKENRGLDQMLKREE
jgi:hypothetical protein